MAKKPAEGLAWDGQQYADYGAQWDEAVRHCRSVLHDWARERKTGTYTELANVVREIDWPEGAYTHRGSQMGYLLGQASLDELDVDDDRPVISALVYGAEDNLPSHGFWSFLDELGVSVAPTEDARLTFWSREVDRCHKVYGSLDHR